MCMESYMYEIFETIDQCQFSLGVFYKINVCKMKDGFEKFLYIFFSWDIYMSKFKYKNWKE